MAVTFVEVAPLSVRLSGPLHIGTGYRRGLIHRTVVRGGDGLVYLPASSLKGRVRTACQALVATYCPRPCHAPRPEAMRQCRDDGCLVCRVFGAPGQGSDLMWHDANLTTDWREALAPRGSGPFGQTYARTQVQLSRALGTAAEERLYTGEVAAEGLTLVSPAGVSGWLELTPIAGDKNAFYELVLLLAGFRLVKSIGGNVSRGAGACQVELPDNVVADGRSLSVVGLLEFVDLLKDYPA